LKRDPRFKVVVGATEGETILALNNAKPPFNDKRVRQAISYALDRKAIIDGAMFGYGQPIGSHFSPLDPGYVDLTGRYPHDPARARALLRAAGFGDGLEVTLKLPPPSYARRSGEIIAAQLAEVGVRARIENLEWAQWLDGVLARKDFDMTIVAHTEPADLDIYARPDYYFGYRNPAFDALMARIGAETNAPRRNALLGEAQRMIADDAVNGFLFLFPKLGVWRADVGGLWRDAPVQATDVTAAYRTGAAVRTQMAPSPWPARIGWALGALALAGVAALIAMAGRSNPAYVSQRLVAMALTLAASTAVIFLLLSVVPGDPAQFMMGLNADPVALAAVRQELGLAGAPLERYGAWLSGLAQGDFGVSYTYRVPVAHLIGERLAVSAPLALYALALTVAIAFPVGVWAASRRGQWPDVAAMGAAQLGLAAPNFWVALLLVLVFALGLGWLPAGGFPGWEAGLGAGLAALTLPAIALALTQAAILARVLRASLIETLSEDYVRTARAKGLTQRQALWRHALPNALGPVLAILGLQFGFLLAGAVIVETVFSLPGLGRLAFQAIVQRDLIVVQGVVLLLVAAVVLMAFLVDLAQAALDPRLSAARRA
jgi:peptide/nickel transport system substrate-binding protein